MILIKMPHGLINHVSVFEEKLKVSLQKNPMSKIRNVIDRCIVYAFTFQKAMKQQIINIHKSILIKKKQKKRQNMDN